MKNLKRKIGLAIIGATISVTAAGCGLFSEKAAPEPVESVKEKVIDHLEEQGYKKEDYQINVKYHKTGESKFGGPYAIDVTFNDETNVIYNYKYDHKSDDKEITQIGVAPMKGKDDKNFKHVE